MRSSTAPRRTGHVDLWNFRPFTACARISQYDFNIYGSVKDPGLPDMGLANILNKLVLVIRVRGQVEDVAEFSREPRSV